MRVLMTSKYSGLFTCTLKRPSCSTESMPGTRRYAVFVRKKREFTRVAPFVAGMDLAVAIRLEYATPRAALSRASSRKSG